MNKQKKISPPPPHPQSRSSRMRMLTKSSSGIGFDFGTIYQANINVISQLEKRGINMTEQELKDYINNMPRIGYCNDVMGVSCGDGGLTNFDTTDFNQWGPFTKWWRSGGRCPQDRGADLFLSDNCTTGCKYLSGRCV